MLLPVISFSQNLEKAIKENTGKRIDTLVHFKTDSPYNYMPVTIISGKEKGPVFTIVAGIHGFEYPPISAVQELIKEIDPNNLKGTLVVIPIANVGSFYKRTPFVNPLDNKNLNNAFPGSKSGTITEQIANYITKEIIPNSDVFLDVHAGDANEDLLPFVCYYNNTSEEKNTELSAKLSEISGINHIVSYPYTITKTEPAKYAFKQASQNGKTALSIEAGKLGNVQTESVHLIKKAVYNMLNYMDIYAKGTTPTKNPSAVYLKNQEYVKAEFSGVFHSNLKSGDYIKKEDKIGFISDEFGTVLNEIKAPATGVVLYKIGTPPVNKGETVFCIGF
ncbi:succinylglutamate desuccinylase/aspartoacylase family protein [Flavobacterium sp. 17A]|uniref:Succinylglutamate desuccinylase/aspartoacylase family protein n=2 Tax=Flavobacterium potami TaxID=2872310 RepID=A0A9X1HAE5_9FLAO|nr:M14 family metallopeptidase [Flavobacterium potami]MBZ4035495.1 succinylglutamate desuccinylase/aspartoacylase family protein [Flavobacterium potami]